MPERMGEYLNSWRQKGDTETVRTWLEENLIFCKCF